MNDSTPVLHAQTLVKAYEEGNNELEVLKGVDLTVHKGDIVSRRELDDLVNRRSSASSSPNASR